MESVQRIVVRAEVLRRRLATSCSIEHLAQRHAVYDAAVHAKTHDAPRPLVHHDEHPVRVENGRFAPKQIKTPQTVLRVTQDREPGRPAASGFGWYRAARMRRTTSLLMGIPKARVIWCAIRGHPQIGFRCFMSTTAAMTSWLGPFGPGFIDLLEEKSRRYFRWISARCRLNSVDGLKTIAERMNRPGRIKSAHRPTTTRSAGRRLGDRFRDRLRISS